jgi:tellurite resistance protein TehA-like permease
MSTQSVVNEKKVELTGIMRYCLMLSSFPPGIMGMALGMCGGASIYLEFVNMNPTIKPVAEAFYEFHNVAAVALLTLFIMRMFADVKKVKKELYLVDVIPPYASGQMAALFVTARALFYVAGSSGAQIVVYIWALVQLLLMFGFFYRCYQTSTYPEPFWNPPTVKKNCKTHENVMFES